ncbi:MAG TPA: DNA repair protein RadA [Aliidongia sp.]|uniref:DNA repair protein RadA n=1 Tax=Aliidongia sp. TaxID=1914230 RepID=UPI002DDCF583|nr:DNA repair protein RadA [Aliidongia sp.]HEV2678649.1 DNA repair protein RadA [Aliidongia sp.]
MARPRSRFVCQECGAVHTKWSGRCDACGGWNCLIEEVEPEGPPKGLGAAGVAKGKRIAFVGLEGSAEAAPRRLTGIAEFDRVCGGGLVPGSALLVGGDPGIGKSTLLLQVVASLAIGKAKCVYISGEESIDQIRLRATRLGVTGAPVELAAATSIRDIAASLDHAQAADIVVIDSIQTMYLDTLDSSPGTVSQVRAAAQELIRLAKRVGFTLILVGHVTKDGAIAGPRVLEHMVDAVLYFEGERGHQFRILRAVKNRFGPTDEIGVFEMTDAGLSEVANPSALFLADRHGAVSGAAVFAGMEGTRPVLVEIQALVAPSPPGTPRRAVVGWDSARLAMVMAVLDARCGLAIGSNDVYLNVAGGLRISEPAADLAVAAALVSALTGQPVPAEMVVFGEIGLSGEIRPVSQSDARLKEAGKLGFERALGPARRGRQKPASAGIVQNEIGHLQELVDMFDTEGTNTPTTRA